MRWTILPLMLVLSGCASLMKDFQDRTCYCDGAFEYGANHVRSHQPMNGRSLTDQCPSETQVQAMKGYRDGYISIETRPRVEIKNGP